MKKFILFIICLIAVTSTIYFSNDYISNADNYISLTKLKDEVGEKKYNQILSYYNSVGIDKETFNSYIIELNKELQALLDSQTFIENFNTYIFFKNNENTKDIGNIIIKEVDYVNTLSQEDKLLYKQVLEEILNYG